MTTYTEAKDAIQTQFLTVWNAAALVGGESRPPISWANLPFKPPEDSTWARATIIHDPSLQVGIGGVGSRYFRNFGTIFINVFVPIETGTITLNRWAEVGKLAFEGIEAGNVTFQETSIREQPVEEAWVSSLITSTFYYDSIK